MHARRYQRVAVVAANVDAGPNLAHGVADRRFGGIHEPDVPAARGDDLDGGRQRAMLGLELAQLGFGIDAVDVDYEDV